MRRWIWLVLALVAMSCSGPEKPEGWRVERNTGDDTTTGGVCDDVEAVALGELADHQDLEPVLDELSRLAAVLGATAALPAFDDVRTSLAATTDPDDPPSVDVAAELDTAADALDAAAYAECDIPLFTAMYAATGWLYCHAEVDVAVTLYMAAPDPDVRSCTADDTPLYLPCWQVDETGYLPVDCLTDEIVAVDGGEWVSAGAPRTTTTTTTTTTTVAVTTTTAAPVIEQIVRPECTALADLFVGDDPIRGDETDLERILDSTSLLGTFIIDLVTSFEEASQAGSTLEVFEEIVSALDSATVDECGIPVISGAFHFVGGVEELPCWIPTGGTYPAYEPTDCVD